jgi:hypothetical protein
MNNHSHLKAALSWIADLILGSIGFVLLERVYEMIGINWILGIAGLVLVIIATALATYLLLKRSRKSIIPDTRFTHLTVYLSRRDDTPDTPSPARPRYVVNSQTNQAYWVSDLIEPYFQQHKISWYSFNDEKELRNQFRKWHIITNDAPQKQPEDLGLHLNHDGLLECVDLNLDRLLKKLDGRKIDGVTIFKLYPWHYYYRKKRSYTNKRLLLKRSTNEAFIAPFHDLELIDRELIDSDSKCRRPFESLRCWSKRMKYTYMDRRYTEAELLEQGL